MNRTIEQWRDFDCADAAYNDPREFISELLQGAISDLQELARQRDELAGALELCMNAVKLAGWEGDFCMDKARAAMQSIKEQTK